MSANTIPAFLKAMGTLAATEKKDLLKAKMAERVKRAKEVKLEKAEVAKKVKSKLFNLY